MAGKLGRLALLAVCMVAGSNDLHAQFRTDRGTATFSGTNYIVQAGDVLHVRIWGWPEPQSALDSNFPVEQSGMAYLPVVGPLMVAGKNAEQVQEEFRKKFAQEQRNPVVTVEPLFVVSVMGEVRGPGVLDVRPGYTIFDAISIAGGFTETAQRNAVILVRNGQSREVAAASPSEAIKLLADTPLESGDRIVVTRSRSSRLAFWSLILQSAISVANFILILSR